eukprot:159760-Pleurochrysis_carterae.AAC.2
MQAPSWPTPSRAGASASALPTKRERPATPRGDAASGGGRAADASEGQRLRLGGNALNLVAERTGEERMLPMRRKELAVLQKPDWIPRSSSTPDPNLSCKSDASSKSRANTGK